MTAPIPVRPGQIWADADWRNKGRTVRVIGTDKIRFATYEVVTDPDSPYTMRSTIGRWFRVQYDHRGLRGYRLVSEPDDTAGSAT